MNDTQSARVRLLLMQRTQLVQALLAAKDGEAHIQPEAKRISALEKAASGGSTPKTANRK